MSLQATGKALTRASFVSTLERSSFDLGGMTWVSLSHGVHAFKVGEAARFELDVARCLYFAPDGARVAG